MAFYTQFIVFFKKITNISCVFYVIGYNDKEWNSVVMRHSGNARRIPQIFGGYR